MYSYKFKLQCSKADNMASCVSVSRMKLDVNEALKIDSHPTSKCGKTFRDEMKFMVDNSKWRKDY